MPVFYLDTSALTKLYRSEIGTPVIERLVNTRSATDRFFTSVLTVLELTSTVTRLMKGGEMRERSAGLIFGQLLEATRSWLREWPLDNGTVSRAIPLAKEYQLRAGDALQMATALEIFAIVPEVNVAVVSADRNLLRACNAHGVVVLDPARPDALDLLARLRG